MPADCEGGLETGTGEWRRPSGELCAPQLKPPALLKHCVSGSQPPLFTSHSFTSLQVRPLPENPGGHGPQRNCIPESACRRASESRGKR